MILLKLLAVSFCKSVFVSFDNAEHFLQMENNFFLIYCVFWTTEEAQIHSKNVTIESNISVILIYISLLVITNHIISRGDRVFIINRMSDDDALYLLLLFHFLRLILLNNSTQFEDAYHVSGIAVRCKYTYIPSCAIEYANENKQQTC